MNKLRSSFFRFSISILFFNILISCTKEPDPIIPPDPEPIVVNYPEVIGSAHVSQRYYFGTQDCLNEGADRLLEMGSKVIKIWYYHGIEKPNIMYPWNSKWVLANSLATGIDNSYYADLFNKPFKTYIMVVASFVDKTNAYYWKDNLTQAQIDQEEKEFYEFTKVLLKKYEGTGKTFILQHHEGDWHLRGNVDANLDPDPAAFERMIKWLNARQRGVTKARDEMKAKNVFVYNAAEINLVVKSLKEGKPNMVNKVLPFTNLDLVSYSCYDASTPASDGNLQLLSDAIKYIKLNMPDSSPYGNDNVYIGEYGMPENIFNIFQLKAVFSNVMNVGVQQKCPYIVYWQLYCNELAAANIVPPVKNNTDVKGFWLIRPDGTKSAQYDYLYGLCHKN